MSAVVCGKRSSSIFDEILHASPPPPSKRSHCASAGVCSPSFDRIDSDLAHLSSLFPDMDPQILERTLEASGNNLDSAIKSLNDLCLEPSEINLDAAASENGMPNISLLATKGVANGCGVGSTPGNPPASEKLPTNGSEWVELFVSEMMNASDMDDARARASRALEVLEKSIMSSIGAEAMQNFQKENLKLKEQVEALLRENAILKRSVAIQHERQKEYGERNQEVQHLKQLVSQYQEQVKTLEINNYALTMHLRQAQQSSSIPGRFHPDVF